MLNSKAQQREELEDLEATEERREGFFSFADRTPLALEGAAPLDPDDVWDEAQ